MGGLFYKAYELQLQDTKDHYQNEWLWRSKHSHLEITAGVLTTLGWFLLAVPLVQVTVMLSSRGTRMLGLHSAVGVLTVGAATTELCANLMYHGGYQALDYIASNVNLEDFSTTGDEAGWKVLSMLTLFAKGMTHIVNHMEMLFLSAIFALLFVSVFSHSEKLFGTRWAIYSAALSGLCLVSFVVELGNTTGGFEFSHLIVGITKIALLPVWILWLGKQLPAASKAAKESAKKEGESEMTQRNIAENEFSYT